MNLNEFTDYELMQMLDEAGYEPTKDNIELLDESELFSKVLIESVSDEYLMEILDECGYEPSWENVAILRETEILDEGLRSAIIGAMNKNKVLRHFVGAKTKGKQLARDQHKLAKLQARGADQSKIDKMQKRVTAGEESIAKSISSKNAARAANAMDDKTERLVKRDRKAINRQITKANANDAVQKNLDKIKVSRNKASEYGANLKSYSDRNKSTATVPEQSKIAGSPSSLNKKDGKIEYIEESYTFTAYQLMQILDEAGYEPSIDNVMTLVEDKIPLSPAKLTRKEKQEKKELERKDKQEKKELKRKEKQEDWEKNQYFPNSWSI